MLNSTENSLESLNLKNENPKMFIKCEDVKILDITSESADQNFNDILAKCSSLRHLTLSDVQNLNFENVNFNFSLESLKIEKVSTNIFSLKKLLATSLRKLSISLELNSQMMNLILCELKLVELEIDVASISNAIDENSINKSIEKLTLWHEPGNYCGDLSNAFNFYLKCSKIKNLQVNFDQKNLETFLRNFNIENSPNLKALKIKKFPDDFPIEWRLPQIISLEIDEIATKDEIQLGIIFLKNLPNVKDLKISQICDDLWQNHQTHFKSLIDLSKSLEKIHFGVKELPDEFKAQLRTCLVSSRPLRRFTFVGDSSEEPKREFGLFDERRLIYKEPKEFFDFDSEFCLGKKFHQKSPDLIQTDAIWILNINKEDRDEPLKVYEKPSKIKNFVKKLLSLSHN